MLEIKFVYLDGWMKMMLRGLGINYSPPFKLLAVNCIRNTSLQVCCIHVTFSVLFFTRLFFTSLLATKLHKLTVLCLIIQVFLLLLR